MIPPGILEGFKNLPREIVDLCRPHPWGDLTPPPREGMKSVRDVLVHMIGAVLRPWEPQRAATHEQYHRGQIFTRLALLGRQDLPDYDVLR